VQYIESCVTVYRDLMRCKLVKEWHKRDANYHRNSSAEWGSFYLFKLGCRTKKHLVSVQYSTKRKSELRTSQIKVQCSIPWMAFAQQTCWLCHVTTSSVIKRVPIGFVSFLSFCAYNHQAALKNVSKSAILLAASWRSADVRILPAKSS